MELNDKNIKKAKRMFKVLKAVKFKIPQKEKERLTCISQCEKIISDYENMKEVKK